MVLALVVSLLVTASVEELCFFWESVLSVGTSAPQILRSVVPRVPEAISVLATVAPKAVAASLVIWVYKNCPANARQ